MSARLGEHEEALVREYLQRPTQDVRDKIVAFSERFIKLSYKKYLRTVMLYEDYLPDAVCKVLDLLDRFDPARASQVDANKNVSFIYWVMFSLEGFAKATRFRAMRYMKVHRYSSRATLERQSWGGGIDDETPVFDPKRKAYVSRVDRDALTRSVYQIVSRYTTQNELRLMRYIYKHLLECNEFPTFRDLMATKFATVFSHREIYNYLNYAIREVRILLYRSCS